MSKRTLEEIETELETAKRLEEETKDRVKRLKTERDTHEDTMRMAKERREASLSAELPSYLYEALVAHPLDPDTYGAFRSFDISHEQDSRHIKRGIYASQLLITVSFEKKTIDYEEDTDNGSYISHDVFVPHSTDSEGHPTMTQQELWTKALAMNKQDVGKALIVLCRDCYMLIDDYVDTPVSWPLTEIEVYRRTWCKLPNLTVDDLKTFYDLDAFAWLTKRCPLDGVDMAAQVARVNSTRNLFKRK